MKTIAIALFVLMGVMNGAAWAQEAEPTAGEKEYVAWAHSVWKTRVRSFILPMMPSLLYHQHHEHRQAKYNEDGGRSCSIT